MNKMTQKHKTRLFSFLIKRKKETNDHPYKSFKVTKDGGFYANPSEILTNPEIQRKMRESHKILFPDKHKELFPEEYK